MVMVRDWIIGKFLFVLVHHGPTLSLYEHELGVKKWLSSDIMVPINAYFHCLCLYRVSQLSSIKILKYANAMKLDRTTVMFAITWRSYSDYLHSA